MDELEQLERAIVAADAAGDTEAVELLSAEIVRLQGAEQDEPQTEEQVERTIGQRLLRQLGLTGRAVIEGGANLVGLLSDPVNAITNMAISPATDFRFGRVGDAAAQTADDLGLPQAETPTERVVQAASKAVVGGAGSVGLSQLAASKLAQGGGSMAANIMAKQPAAQLSGAAGSGAAQQTVAEAGGGTGAQIAAALAGGYAGARAGIKPPKAPGVADDFKQVKDTGVKILTSDIITPETFAAKWLQRTGEMIPVAGTGGVRKAQQVTRIDAIKDTLRNFGVTDVSARIIDDVADDMLKTNKAAFDKFSKLKFGVIDSLESAGDVPVTKSLAAIDAQITKVSEIGLGANKPVIAILEDFKQALQGKNITQVDELRKSLGKAFEAEQFAGVKDIGEKSLRAIYRPLKQDMGAFIKTNGKPKDFTKWKVADKELTKLSGDLEKTALKSVLNKAEATPEDVKRLLFSAKPSDVKALYKNLSPKGRASARAAVLQESLEKAGEQISPEKFVNQLKKRADQVGVFFSGDDLKTIKGLTKAIDMTRQASRAAAAPPTGERAVPIVGAAVLTDVLGGSGAALASGATIGGMARLYESAPVRNLLIKLADSSLTEPEGAAILKRIIAIAQTSEQEQ